MRIPYVCDAGWVGADVASQIQDFTVANADVDLCTVAAAAMAGGLGISNMTLGEVGLHEMQTTCTYAQALPKHPNYIHTPFFAYQLHAKVRLNAMHTPQCLLV